MKNASPPDPIVFVSSAGPRSRPVAQALAKLLQHSLGSAEAAFEASQMPGATNWSERISNELRRANVCILCVTAENRHSRWLHYEAGAIRIQQSPSCVFVLSIDEQPIELGPPLSELQRTSADREGIGLMLEQIAGLVTRDEEFDLHMDALLTAVALARTACSEAPTSLPSIIEASDALDSAPRFRRVVRNSLLRETKSALEDARPERHVSEDVAAFESAVARALVNAPPGSCAVALCGDKSALASVELYYESFFAFAREMEEFSRTASPGRTSPTAIHVCRVFVCPSTVAAVLGPDARQPAFGQTEALAAHDEHAGVGVCALRLAWTKLESLGTSHPELRATIEDGLGVVIVLRSDRSLVCAHEGRGDRFRFVNFQKAANRRIVLNLLEMLLGQGEVAPNVSLKKLLPEFRERLREFGGLRIAKGSEEL